MMPITSDGFVGQLCWVCEQPIIGEGIFDKPPDGVGTTSYHEKCWADSHVYGHLPTACFIIRLDQARVIEKGKGEATVEDANGKRWSLPLEFVDEHWVCPNLRADVFHFVGQTYLVIKIEDQDAGN